MKQISIIMLCVFTLSACEPGSKEGFGTMMGALGGAILGSAISDNGRGGSGNGMVIGALAGGILGNAIGRSLDDADKKEMYRAQQAAFESYPSGEASNWYNPDSGNSGSYVPQPAVQNNQGEYCREYQQTITIGGETKNAYGKACRQEDGDWKIVSDRS
ncbi:MAG: glycine zipper 2TM domain-containing protein [Emcibacteraceae bacterium]|nr:glycine zipper 2TM domain-containing protein [Emcibacteraceae bacterium]